MAGKIQNEDIKSSAELIAAGGAASQLPNDDKIYVTANGIAKTLKQAIIDGDISGGGSLYSNTPQVLTGGGSITLTAGKAMQMVQIGGTGGQTTVSTTPFGTGTFTDGQLVEIIGNDDTNPVEIPFNDASKGAVGNFTSIILNRFETARFIYSTSLSRWVGGKR